MTTSTDYETDFAGRLPPNVTYLGEINLGEFETEEEFQAALQAWLAGPAKKFAAERAQALAAARAEG